MTRRAAREAAAAAAAQAAAAEAAHATPAPPAPTPVTPAWDPSAAPVPPTPEPPLTSGRIVISVPSEGTHRTPVTRHVQPTTPADPPTRALPVPQDDLDGQPALPYARGAAASAAASSAAHDEPMHYGSAVATAERPGPSNDPFAQLLAGDDEPVDARWAAPAPRRKRRRGLGLTIALIVIVALVGGGVWAWNTYSPQLKNVFGSQAPADYASGKAHGEAAITVNSGDIPSTISNTLYKAGVTKSPTVFYQMLLTKGLNPTFYPGVYKLQKEMTASAALKAMEDPKNKLDHSVVLPEGLTESQILQRVSTGLNIPLADLKTAVKNPRDYGVNQDSLEGWLFPALYQFNPGTSAHDVVKAMVDRMKQELSDAGVAPADQQKILTIASIVQREARQSQDFGKVARVIDNRLAQGMKLQMDSTAQYGYGSLHNGTASSSQAALDDPNPWNTYAHTGLPKGPIASPGAQAITAALNPTPGSWLYFTTVNMNTGETVFSTTYAEHDKAVHQMQAWCKANPGTGC
jgi:UPF0755 protein